MTEETKKENCKRRVCACQSRLTTRAVAGLSEKVATELDNPDRPLKELLDDSKDSN